MIGLISCKTSPKIEGIAIDTFCTNYSKVQFKKMSDQAINAWFNDLSKMAYVNPKRFANSKEEYMYYLLNAVYENEKLYEDKNCRDYEKTN